ncbi:Crp/Fnr family transcriptional regulator [Dehalogenimonas sp. THU2]|uniref:Crp/Fnr family transcriptional regulator n=1 Tax=Dehalogenimonas sp. THU2 TaxID=3151121 RepID=UPI003218886E
MKTEAIVAALKRSYLFATSSETDLADLVAAAEFRQFAAGEYIFWEAEPSERFYLLTRGRVKVVKHGSQGRETVVGFFGPGEVFGEVAVLEGKPYPASSVAAEDVEVLAVSQQVFRDFIARHPGVAMAMVAILSARLREAQSRLHDLSGERVEQRLARTLERLASKLGRELPFTRQDLADMSGTTLETTIRFLSRLKEGKIITSRRGLVIIEDEEKLRLLAEGPPQA